MGPLTIYFVFNAFLFLGSGYIFFKTTPDLLKKREYLSFRTFIISFGVYSVLNTLWTMNEFGIISLPKMLFTVLCAFSLASVVFVSFIFYKFVMIYFRISNREKTVYELLSLLPFLMTVVLLIISIFNGIVFSTSDEGKLVRGPLYYSLPAAAFLYFLIILVSSLIVFIKSKSPVSRKNCITILCVVICLVAWIILDSFLNSLTIIPIAIFSVILVLFTTFQQSSINTDALTQMNNRRRATEFLSTHMSNVSEESPIHLYLCDINSFKKINDSYGHNEGDSALIILASSLKEIVGSVKGFTARYGGDEFIIAVKNNAKDYDVNEIIHKLGERVKEKCIEEKKPYELSIASGYIKCTDPKVSVDEYIRIADELLYKQKESLYN